MRIGNFKVTWKHLVEQGKTVCSVYKDDELINAGIATLSKSDQYDRRVCRKVSLTRALLESELPKSDRNFIWSGIREQVKI